MGERDAAILLGLLSGVPRSEIVVGSLTSWLLALLALLLAA